MPFAKIDCAILDSSVWPDRDLRDLFLTAVFKAGPWDSTDPIPTFEVATGRRSAFVVPPGWYGLVESSAPALIEKAGLPPARGLDVLEQLGAPDPHSRSPDFDGRRLVRIDRGYLVLNFEKYRERDYGAADRMRRWRKRQAAKTVTANVTPETPNESVSASPIPPVTPIVTQAEAEAEAEGIARAPAPGPIDYAPRPRQRETAGLLGRFPDAYRGDVETALGSSQNAYALERELAAFLDGMPPYRPMAPEVLGAAIRDLLLDGGKITGFRIQAFAKGRDRVAGHAADDPNGFHAAARQLSGAVEALNPK